MKELACLSCKYCKGRTFASSFSGKVVSCVSCSKMGVDYWKGSLCSDFSPRSFVQLDLFDFLEGVSLESLVG